REREREHALASGSGHMELPLSFFLKIWSSGRMRPPPLTGGTHSSVPPCADLSKDETGAGGRTGASVGVPPHQEFVPQALEEPGLGDLLQRHQRPLGDHLA